MENNLRFMNTCRLFRLFLSFLQKINAGTFCERQGNVPGCVRPKSPGIYNEGTAASWMVKRKHSPKRYLKIISLPVVRLIMNSLEDIDPETSQHRHKQGKDQLSSNCLRVSSAAHGTATSGSLPSKACSTFSIISPSIPWSW